VGYRRSSRPKQFISRCSPKAEICSERLSCEIQIEKNCLGCADYKNNLFGFQVFLPELALNPPKSAARRADSASRR
jgi:hypothetical protein